MKKNDKRYHTYLNILKQELLPAMGCTEPIAIAYAAAKAREVLEKLPERVEIEASDNIIKNVKSAVVPNSNNLKGIIAAAAAGIVMGDADKKLEVLATAVPDSDKKIDDFITNCEFKVKRSPSDLALDLTVTLFCDNDIVSVQIAHYHTNIILIQKNDIPIYRGQDCQDINSTNHDDYKQLTVEGIVEFAEAVEIDEISSLLQRQINDNMAIAMAGLNGNWAANIGSVLLKCWGNNIRTRAKALAAAGSDARMGGCELPVMIISGSGNQGITASVPVIEYAKELKSDNDDLLRALVVANLVSIHQKAGIGCLSAYCGAVCAGAGAGSGIAWLHGGRLKEIAHTIVNTLAIVSGIICDGAKPSCAAKIAVSVDAGILGFYMYQQGEQFYDGDGIVKKGVENTIDNVSRIGGYGMRETDKEVIRIMLEK